MGQARGYRTGENPARWRGHLDHLLPAKAKVRKVEHHAALPYARIGAFLAALRKQNGIAARALEFLVLTATRTGETLGATWNEVDLGAKLWTIPAGRMKAGKEHRVPLSDAALAVLQQMHDIRHSDYVFPGGRDRRPLSETSLLMLLRRMGHGDITAHGFRSTFRDWAAERTTFAREVAEMALAHAIPDAVEAAYRRGDLFEKRRKLMARLGRVLRQDRDGRGQGGRAGAESKEIRDGTRLGAPLGCGKRMCGAMEADPFEQPYWNLDNTSFGWPVAILPPFSGRPIVQMQARTRQPVVRVHQELKVDRQKVETEAIRAIKGGYIKASCQVQRKVVYA